MRISTYSFAGVVRLGPIALHIEPKLAELSPAGMASLLRYALGMDMLRTWGADADVALEAGGFAELLALALLEEVNGLLRAGLLQEYETHASWRASPRGKIDLTELARSPARGQTAMAIPCRVSERVTDGVLNRTRRRDPGRGPSPGNGSPKSPSTCTAGRRCSRNCADRSRSRTACWRMRLRPSLAAASATSRSSPSPS